MKFFSSNPPNPVLTAQIQWQECRRHKKTAGLRTQEQGSRGLRVLQVRKLDGKSQTWGRNRDRVQSQSGGSHITIVRAAPAFGRHPVDDLVGVHYVAGLAVYAVGKIYLKPPL